MGKFVNRHVVRDSEWSVWQLDNGKYDDTAVTRAILLDIREELKRLNSLLHCHNFTAIPFKLDAIKRNTTKKRKPKKATPKLRVVRTGS